MKQLSRKSRYSMASYAGLRAQVPEEVQQKVETARQQILAGTLEVPQIDFSAEE